LALARHRPRADGYHEIDTVLQTISLHDTITLTRTNDHQITLVATIGSLPIDEKNLAYRAATALQARYELNEGTRIRLEKRIPAQAGLGGGSSDAAMTLIGLSHLWETGASIEELLELPRAWAPTCPFFSTEARPTPVVREQKYFLQWMRRRSPCWC